MEVTCARGQGEGGRGGYRTGAKLGWGFVSEEGIEVSRLMEGGLKQSRAIDTEALCVCWREKEGGLKVHLQGPVEGGQRAERGRGLPLLTLLSSYPCFAFSIPHLFTPLDVVAGC